MNTAQQRGVRVPVEKRLHRLNVEVPDPSTLPWPDAVRSGAPQTNPTGRVWGAERAFKDLPVVAGPIEVQLIYFGSPQREYHDLEAYAEANYLASAHPRQWFAALEQFPDLRKLLKCTADDICSVALPRKFAFADGMSRESVLHTLVNHEGQRVAEFTDASRRRAYIWEWFAFVPVFRHLHAVK